MQSIFKIFSDVGHECGFCQKEITDKILDCKKNLPVLSDLSPHFDDYGTTNWKETNKLWIHYERFLLLEL